MERSCLTTKKGITGVRIPTTKSAIGAHPSTAGTSLASRAIRTAGPRAASNLRTRVTQQLRQTVTVTRNGRPVKMRKADLIALQIVDAAAKGDLKAAVLVVRLV